MTELTVTPNEIQRPLGLSVSLIEWIAVAEAADEVNQRGQTANKHHRGINLIKFAVSSIVQSALSAILLKLVSRNLYNHLMCLTL